MQDARPASLLLPGGSLAAAAASQNRRVALHESVGNAKRPGVRTAGKVFFSRGAFDYECSGTVVRSPSRSLVLSAGHCAYVENAVGGGGAYPVNWMFVPAYRDGLAPFGKWAAASLQATPEWVSSVNSDITGQVGGDSRFDVSAAILAARRGKRIQDVVGGRTPRFDASRSAVFNAFGYPAESPFDGRSEFECRSPLTQSDASRGAPATIGIACDMNGGASGGGWIVNRRYIESLTSYNYTDDRDTLYGPYFGTAIKAFYNSVKSG